MKFDFEEIFDRTIMINKALTIIEYHCGNLTVKMPPDLSMENRHEEYFR